LSGEVVFRQGDMGTDFYIIYQGNVDIKIHKNNQDVIVATLGEGEYFGEIALFDNQPRTATVVAHNDCILLRLSQKVFLDLARQRPEILLNICRVLSQRLRDVEKKT
jgi:CRP-like cAMP-binding protein